jgi:hypothetical protein
MYKKKAVLMIFMSSLAINQNLLFAQGDFSIVPSQEMIDRANGNSQGSGQMNIIVNKDGSILVPSRAEPNHPPVVKKESSDILFEQNDKKLDQDVLFVQEEPKETPKINMNKISYAIQTENMEILNEAINGSNVNYEVYDGNTILHAAAMKKNIDMLNIGLSAGANLKKKNKYGDNFLLIAAQSANISFLKVAKSNIDTKIWGELIVEKGKSKRNILHNAFVNPNSTITNEYIEWLVKEGNFVNEKDSDGYTPVYYAIAQQKWEALAILLKSGGLLSIEDPDGISYEKLLLDKMPIIESPALFDYFSNSGKEYLVGIIDTLTFRYDARFKMFEEFQNKK